MKTSSFERKCLEKREPWGTLIVQEYLGKKISHHALSGHWYHDPGGPGSSLSWCQTLMLFTGHRLYRDEEHKNCWYIDVSAKISKETLRGQAVFRRVRIPVGRPWKKGVLRMTAVQASVWAFHQDGTQGPLVDLVLIRTLQITAFPIMCIHSFFFS